MFLKLALWSYSNPYFPGFKGLVCLGGEMGMVWCGLPVQTTNSATCQLWGRGFKQCCQWWIASHISSEVSWERKGTKVNALVEHPSTVWCNRPKNVFYQSSLLEASSSCKSVTDNLKHIFSTNGNTLNMQLQTLYLYLIIIYTHLSCSGSGDGVAYILHLKSCKSPIPFIFPNDHIVWLTVGTLLVELSVQKDQQLL